MEASFFCEKLLQEAPNDIEGNKLAFLLAIAKMDPNVEKYDINLANSGATDKDRFILHCRYYFAFFSIRQAAGKPQSRYERRHLRYRFLQCRN